MKSFTIHSVLSKKEVYFTMQKLEPLFIGDIKEDRFSIMKKLHFSNNSLNPKIDAIITEQESGTDIHIKMSLNKYDKVGFSTLGILWCGVLIFLIISAIMSGSLAPLFPAIALLIFETLAIVIYYFIYTIRVKKVVKMLKKALA